MSGCGTSGDTVGATDPVATALPCAAPSDAPGVTDQEITLGSLASLTGPVPAASAAMARALADAGDTLGSPSTSPPGPP